MSNHGPTASTIGARAGLRPDLAELRQPVIAGACRTAIGTFGGGLASFPAWRLGEVVIKETSGAPASARTLLMK